VAVDYVNIGNRIRRHRLRRKLSQEQLAELCDCSNVYISCVERAEKKPSLEIIISIANALSISADEILSASLEVSHSRMVTRVLELLYESTMEEQEILLKSMSQLKQTLRDYSITR